MTNRLIVVERRVVWGWKSGWLELRDWLFGVERLVVWGWGIGCLGLRDWLFGVDRYKRTKVHFFHLQLLQASGSSYCTHATPRRRWCRCKNEQNWNLKCNLGPLETWPRKVMQNQIRTLTLHLRSVQKQSAWWGLGGAESTRDVQINQIQKTKPLISVQRKRYWSKAELYSLQKYY